jgi:serine/threonine protein kinase
MLNLAFSTKKDNENFDRRRRCGTTRSSDIWSLGCLFYELLTGKWLFYDLEFFKFYTRVTSKDFELITPSNKAELLNNPYLIDFLGSILIRNPMHRPTIEHVITKFQHLNVHLTVKQVANAYLGRNR